jgi:hypothetical protein
MTREPMKTQSARDRILNYFLAHPGKVIDKDELMAVAKISDWARRVRELRDEFGWQISSFNDRSDLKPGEYVLESLTPRDASPRRVPADQRARILARDGFTCQTCGLGAGDPDPDDPQKKVRLHIDHRIPISAGGTNEDGNLRTICSVCNQGRSNLFDPHDDAVNKRINALAMIRRSPRDVQLAIYEFLKNKFDSPGASSQRVFE